MNILSNVRTIGPTLGFVFLLTSAFGCTGEMNTSQRNLGTSTQTSQTPGQTTSTNRPSSTTKVETAAPDMGMETTSPDQGVVVIPTSGPIVMPIRHITPKQYSRMVLDLFDGKLQPGIFNDANKDASRSGYSTEPSANVATGRGIEQLFYASEKVALESVDIMGELLPCSQTSPDDACFESFLDRYAKSAFRRPLKQEERQLLRDAFDQARMKQFSFDEAIAVTLQTMLQMPQFLYVTEIGTEVPGQPNTRALTDHEIAQRLALLFLDSIPDKALTDAADAGLLQDPYEVEKQARRLLASPKASITKRLIQEWLHLDSTIEKDLEAFPQFNSSLQQSMQEELERMFQQSLTQGSTLNEFLLTPKVPINADLAAFYGVSNFSPGPQGWSTVELPLRHQGLLTRPYFLASHASVTSSSHVQRGYTVLKQFLCSQTGPIPEDAMNKVPTYPENSTSRQKSLILRDKADCSVCHQMIDNIGLSFESYDALGNWRSRAPEAEGAQTLDLSGQIVDVGSLKSTDIVGRTFEGVDGLSQLLASSESVERCIPKQWFRYAIGRVESGPEDREVLAELTARFLQTNGSLGEMLIALTQTKAFRTRALQTDTSN